MYAIGVDGLQYNFDLCIASQALIYKSDAHSTNAACIQFVCVYRFTFKLTIFRSCGDDFLSSLPEQYYM